MKRLCTISVEVSLDDEAAYAVECNATPEHEDFGVLADDLADFLESKTRSWIREIQAISEAMRLIGEIR